MNIQPLIKRLVLAGRDNAKRSVEELTACVLDCKPLEIYFKEITPKQKYDLERLIIRAERGEPIQYIVGHVDFRGLKIHCDPRTLIPRHETEQLIHLVLSSTSHSQPAIRIADVGTGTGCIALALLSEIPNAEVTGIDISPTALALACENAKRLGLTERFHPLENNLLKGIDEASFHFIISNPPYIPSGNWKNLDASVKGHEPRIALDGGLEGLDLIRPLIRQAAHVLRPGGSLFLEIGYNQGPSIFQLLEKSGFQNILIQKDHAGLNRIISGVTP